MPYNCLLSLLLHQISFIIYITFHSISYIFFHCHMDRDHLDTLSSLLQSAAESPFVPFCQNFMCIFIGLYTAVPCSVTPAYIFFHHRADFLSLHHKFLLLQSHLFFLSPLSQNILHRSVCPNIPLLQADYFLLTDYLQLPISVSLILSLPFNLPLQNTSSFTVIYTRNFLHKNIAIYKYLCITRYL